MIYLFTYTLFCRLQLPAGLKPSFDFCSVLGLPDDIVTLYVCMIFPGISVSAAAITKCQNW